MRTILLGDIVAAARVVLALSPTQHVEVIDSMLSEADVAHRYFKRFSRSHPQWGNGSLMGRAALLPQAREPFATAPDYLVALRAVIDGLLRRQAIRGGVWSAKLSDF